MNKYEYLIIEIMFSKLYKEVTFVNHFILHYDFIMRMKQLSILLLSFSCLNSRPKKELSGLSQLNNSSKVKT